MNEGDGRPRTPLAVPALVVVVLTVIVIVGVVALTRGGAAGAAPDSPEPSTATSPATPSTVPSRPPTPSASAAPVATPAPTPTRYTIGISLPLTGDAADSTEPIRNGALLAIAEANADGSLPGFVDAVVLDHAVNGLRDALKGANDLQLLAADPDTIGVLSDAGIVDGAGSSPGTFLAGVDPGAGKVVAGLSAGYRAFDGYEAFATRYRAAYGTEPGAYAAGGYACAQVILGGLRSAAAGGHPTRAGVRAAVTASGASFATLFGDVSFTSGGDMMPGTASIYDVDADAAGGAGDWRYVAQVAVDP